MNFDDLNLNNNDIPYIIILSLILSISTIKMMQLSLSGCISNPDVALYLLSGLKYAGLDYFNIVYPQDLFYTPIISFLSSIFFRIGYVDKNAIIFVTSIFCFLGYIGFYILLKNRFNSLLSFTGVIIYSSLPIIIINSTRGLIDLPAISISIWALVFSIISIDKNPKYFLITFPLFVIGFFTKYVVGLTLPLIFLYYILNRNIVNSLDYIISDREIFKQKIKNYLNSAEFKYIIISLIISIILALIICKTLILDFGGSLTFIKQTTNTINGYDFSSAIDYNADKSYYFDHFPYILFEYHKFSLLFSGILFGIFGIGLVINLIHFNNIKHLKSQKKIFKNKYLEKILVIISIILIFISFLSFKKFSNHMISNICLLISLTLFFPYLQKYKINTKKLKLDILFLAYFLINFIFISLFNIKVTRYALIFIPPFIYFIIWSLDSIVYLIKNKITIGKFIPIILVIIFFILNLNFINAPLDYDDSIEAHIDVIYDDFKLDLVDICTFIKNNDHEYHNKTFASIYHHSRIIRWYLNVNITIVDYNNSLKNFNGTDYLILNKNKKLKNYKNIYHKGNFYLYYHN